MRRSHSSRSCRVCYNIDIGIDICLPGRRDPTQHKNNHQRLHYHPSVNRTLPLTPPSSTACHPYPPSIPSAHTQTSQTLSETDQHLRIEPDYYGNATSFDIHSLYAGCLLVAERNALPQACKLTFVGLEGADCRFEFEYVGGKRVVWAKACAGVERRADVTWQVRRSWLSWSCQRRAETWTGSKLRTTSCRLALGRCRPGFF